MPHQGFTNFLTDKISVEAILGATQHEIRAVGGTTIVAVPEAWVLPPVITVQYCPITTGNFSPYTGAGINGMIFFEGQNQNGFDVELENGAGYTLQPGADIGISGPWSANIDVKQVFFNTNVEIHCGTLHSSVHLDPWVISVGVGPIFQFETPGPAPPSGRFERRLAGGQATAFRPCALAPMT